LRARGHQPVIASWLKHRSTVELAGVPFHPLSPDVGTLKGDPEFCREVVDPRFGFVALLQRLVIPDLQDNYEELREVYLGAGLVVANRWTYTASIAAEQFGIKWLSVYLQPLGFFSRFDPPVLPGMPWQTRFGPAARWAHFLTLEIAKQRSLGLVEPIQRLRERVGLRRSARHPIFEWSSPFGNMGWFSRLLGSWRPDWPRRTVTTGFPVYDGSAGYVVDKGIDRFMEQGDQSVVFTLGSSATLEPGNFFEESAAIAKELGIRAVIAGMPGRRPLHTATRSRAAAGAADRFRSLHAVTAQKNMGQTYRCQEESHRAVCSFSPACRGEGHKRHRRRSGSLGSRWLRQCRYTVNPKIQ